VAALHLIIENTFFVLTNSFHEMMNKEQNNNTCIERLSFHHNTFLFNYCGHQYAFQKKYALDCNIFIQLLQ